MLRRTAGAIPKPPKSKVYGFLRRFSVHPRTLSCHKLVLGIETSCDDTGAAVVSTALPNSGSSEVSSKGLGHFLPF